MPAAGQCSRLDDLARELRSYDGERRLEQLVPAIVQSLEGERALSFGALRGDAAPALEFVIVHRISQEAARSALVEALVARGSGGGRPAHGDPADLLNPDERHRNVALRVADAKRQLGACCVLTEGVLARIDARMDDAMRVLLCDREGLLGWFGVFRREPFTGRHCAELQSLVPALRDRLVLERLLRRSRLATAALDAALDAVDAPAYVVCGSHVFHANTAGRAVRDTPGLLDRVRAIAGGTLAAGGVAIRLFAGTEEQLVILSSPSARLGAKVSVAANRWGLTPRQAQVLELLAQGRCNKAIAGELRCSEATVEWHVTDLLHKSESASRAELVARFWGA